MTARLYILIWTIYFVLFSILLNSSPHCLKVVKASEYSGSNEDLLLIASIKNNADRYVSAKSVLWVEKGYLTNKEIQSLHLKIDTAIADIENFIGIRFDANAYHQDKIEYFVHSGRQPSHTITGYQPGKYMHPVIFLSYAIEKNAPYVHETVHIIAWEWRAPWLEEGLAVFLNDTLSGFAAFPNYGEDLDQLAKTLLNCRPALQKIDRNEIPDSTKDYERRAFYILSGSFVKYICNTIGIEKLMQIYRAEDTGKAFIEHTGKTVETWKNEWIRYITLEH